MPFSDNEIVNLKTIMCWTLNVWMEQLYQVIINEIKWAFREKVTRKKSCFYLGPLLEDSLDGCQ